MTKTQQLIEQILRLEDSLVFCVLPKWEAEDTENVLVSCRAQLRELSPSCDPSHHRMPFGPYPKITRTRTCSTAFVTDFMPGSSS